MPPILTFGMPVFNSSKYIAQTLDSLLSQDFQDFVLVISDNASTDNTWEIILEKARKDSRIHPFRQNVNHGSVANFSFVLDKCDTKFFAWASSHDLWSGNFARTLVNELQDNLDVALAYGNSILIDAVDRPLTTETIDERSYTDNDPVVRAVEIVRNLTWCNAFHGIHRTDILKSCRTDIHCIGPDHVLLMDIALRGKIKQNKSCTFFRREYRPKNDSELQEHRCQLQRTLGENFPKQLLDKRYFFWWKEHRKTAWSVPGNPLQKMHRVHAVSRAFVDRWRNQIESEKALKFHDRVERLVSFLGKRQ
jgi:glycosyltransferase involved in cell wall biosynthesis